VEQPAGVPLGFVAMSWIPHTCVKLDFRLDQSL